MIDKYLEILESAEAFYLGKSVKKTLKTLKTDSGKNEAEKEHQNTLSVRPEKTLRSRNFRSNWDC